MKRTLMKERNVIWAKEQMKDSSFSMFASYSPVLLLLCWCRYCRCRLLTVSCQNKLSHFPYFPWFPYSSSSIRISVWNKYVMYSFTCCGYVSAYVILLCSAFSLLWLYHIKHWVFCNITLFSWFLLSMCINAWYYYCCYYKIKCVWRRGKSKFKTALQCTMEMRRDALNQLW